MSVLNSHSSAGNSALAQSPNGMSAGSTMVAPAALSAAIVLSMIAETSASTATPSISKLFSRQTPIRAPRSAFALRNRV